MAITSLDRLLVTQHQGGLLPLGSPTTVLGANSTSSATVTWGFDYQLDGVTYTSGLASARGWLRLAGSVSSSNNAELFNNTTSVFLAPWWDAMETADPAGYIRFEVQGAAPWRRCVIEWQCHLSSGHTAAANDTVTLQCVLYETSNRVEFRYGARVRTGSPAGTISASIGLKGDTSVTATNRRDLWVFDLPMGGSSSSSTTNLTAASYDLLVGTMYVIEPNWPMCGRWVDIPATMLAAPNPLTTPGPGLSPSLAWRIANNVHWLYCRHMPALVNIAPVSQGYVEDPYYVVPVEPSQDNLTYRVEVQTYTASSGTITLDVQSALSSAPQPSDIGDWTSEDDTTETVTAGYQDWGNVVDFALDRNTTFVRFAFDATFAGSDDVRLLSLIMRPLPLDDFDPTATFQSGFVPMGLGQLNQADAGYQAEWLNRGYRNIARILADRWQALWSLSWPEDADYVYTGPDFTPIRVLGAAPASLPSARQRVVAEVYGYDTNDGGKATFLERGGRSVTLTVDSNADTYQLYSSTLDLIGDTPLITFSVDPMAQWRASFCGLRWAPDLPDEDLIAGLTPAPRHEYLATLVARLGLASRTWSMTGLAVRLERTTDTHWVLAWVVPPAVRALWPLIARCDNGSGTAEPTEILADTSGSGAADEVLVPSPLSTRDAWPPDRGTITVAAGSQVFDATPSTAGDRLLESPTSGDWSQGVVETARVTYGVGMTLVPLR